MEVLVPIVLAVFFSALFSGLEMAYLSINKLHVELERQKGRIPYKMLGYLVDRPAPFIAAILVGNNVALVLYGNYMHRWMDPLFESWGGMGIPNSTFGNLCINRGYIGFGRIFT